MDVSSVTQAWPGIFAPSGECSAFTPGRSSYTAGRRRLSRRVRALFSDLQALPGSLAPSGVSLGLGLTLSQRRMPWVMPQATSSAISQCHVLLRHWHHFCLSFRVVRPGSLSQGSHFGFGGYGTGINSGLGPEGKGL